MTLHKRLLLIGSGLLVGSILVIIGNFSYMYDLLGKCMEQNKCQAYPLWDVVNAASFLGAGTGLVLVIIGIVLFFRAIDRADALGDGVHRNS